MNNVHTQKRCEKIATYMLDNNCTVRVAAKHFGIGKTTVHVEVTERLREVNKNLYNKIRVLLDNNWNERQVRGGKALKGYKKTHRRIIWPGW